MNQYAATAITMVSRPSCGGVNRVNILKMDEYAPE